MIMGLDTDKFYVLQAKAALLGVRIKRSGDCVDMSAMNICDRTDDLREFCDVLDAVGLVDKPEPVAPAEPVFIVPVDPVDPVEPEAMVDPVEPEAPVDNDSED